VPAVGDEKTTPKTLGGAAKGNQGNGGEESSPFFQGTCGVEEGKTPIEERERKEKKKKGVVGGNGAPPLLES